MPHRDAYHATRWFGLPGMFMAGILCGALIAAIGYSRHGTTGATVERQIRGWLDDGSGRPAGRPQSGGRSIANPVRTVSI